MANISAPRDNNRVPVLMGTSSVDGVTPVVVYVDPTSHRLLTDIAGGSGTVTSVSVVSANGFAGSVATATTTPAITLSTTITGILSGNGTAISAASTTGSGSVVLATSPTLVTPVLGVAAATSVNKLTITAPATGSTLTIDDGFTLHVTGNVTSFSGSSTGANTGDQNLFRTIAVSGQSDIVADSTTDTLTVAAGSNITLTTDASTDTLTIAASGAGTPTTITVANEATDTTCFPAFFTAATGDLGPKTNASLTFNSNTASLGVTSVVVGNTGLTVGASVPFSDSAGTLTLQNVDALDATTETTIEAAIDTLVNLTSVQGQTLTLAGAFITSGANSLTLTTSGSTNVTLPTTGTLATLAGAETLSSKTLTAPKFANAGFIADANGNELIIFTSTASAVNELTFANGATGVGPTFTASGETNVDLNFQVKGTGAYNLKATASGPTDLRLFEDTDNGTSYVSLIAPASMASNFVLTLQGITGTVYSSGGTDVVVADGGTGLSATTAYAVLCGGTTTTGALQSIASVGTSGQVLTSNGAGALPTFQAASAGSPTMKMATIFETAGRFMASVSGGTNTFGNVGLSQTTTSTTNRFASIAVEGNNATQTDAFNRSPIFTSYLSYNVGSVTGGSAYVGIGSVTVAGTGHTFTNRHAGFKITHSSGFGLLKATQADGTTENASATLATLAAGDQIQLIVKMNTTASVDYYYSINGAAYSTVNLTTNMPTGATNIRLMQFSVSNDNNANTIGWDVFAASYER